MTYPQELYDEGACMGMPVDAFYPTGGATVDYLIARRTCSTCPVQDVCLEWALRNELHGLWGGTTPSERAEIRKKRNIFLEEPMQRAAV